MDRGTSQYPASLVFLNRFNQLYPWWKSFQNRRIFRKDAQYLSAAECEFRGQVDSAQQIPWEKTGDSRVKRMEEHAQNGREYSGKCYISQSACMEDAKAVAQLVEETFPKLDGKVQINNIGTVIGSHTGPGTVALYFWGDERTL